jgi:hypothetical protein
MPNTTVRANARTLPEATNRRAVLRALLAGGATAALPAVSPANAVNEEAEVLALRAEFKRLEVTRHPLVDPTNELSLAFTQMVRESGYETARVWGEQSGFFSVENQLEALDSRANDIMEGMIALRPKTLAGLAALAATMKDDALSSYWNKPDEDRDWDVMLISRFLDGLIERGSFAAGRMNTFEVAEGGRDV